MCSLPESASLPSARILHRVVFAQQRDLLLALPHYFSIISQGSEGPVDRACRVREDLWAQGASTGPSETCVPRGTQVSENLWIGTTTSILRSARNAGFGKKVVGLGAWTGTDGLTPSFHQKTHGLE